MSDGQLTFQAFRAFNKRVDRHDGSREQWLERHESICTQALAFGRNGRAEVAKYLYQRIRDERNLILAFRHIKDEGGPTPGPDGETCESIGVHEFKYADALRDEIDAGNYAHGPTEVRNVRKASGTGTRPLHLINLWDRVVHRAVVQVVGPLLDVEFDPHSFGGRPGLDRRHALAAAERLMAADRRVLVCEDVRDAFEHVPQQRLLGLLRRDLSVKRGDEVKRRAHNRPVRESLHGLLQKLVLTDRGMGLRQGAATSPLLMNLYAHHMLDRKWRRSDVDPPLLRWLDDILIVCGSAEQAEKARGRLERLLLAAGLFLKEPPAEKSTIYDLDSGQVAAWLGFQIGWGDGGLVVRITSRAWAGLRASLGEAAGLSPEDRDVAGRVLGWVGQLGPAYEHTRRPLYYRCLAHSARSLGLQGVPRFERLERTWRSAHERWLYVRVAAAGEAAAV